jgi:hypothetical protein
MSTATTTSRVTCPVCGKPATLIVTEQFGAADGIPAVRRGKLHCHKRCKPSSTQLASLIGGDAADRG